MFDTQGLNDLLAAAVAEPESGKFFPIRTSKAGACPREISAILAGIPRREMTARTMRTLQTGTAAGNTIAEKFASYLHRKVPGAVVQNELAVWTPLPVHGSRMAIHAKCLDWVDGDLDSCPIAISGQDPFPLCVRGRADIIVRNSASPAHVHHIELKTKASYGFKLLEAEGPGDEYLTQHWFLIMGLRAAGLHVDSSHFLFENKDTQEWKLLATDVSKPPPPCYEQAQTHLASILDNFATPSFAMTAGTPLHALGALADMKKKGWAKLPWQCNYCSIGPEAGRCVPGAALNDARKPGANVPAWEIRVR